MFDPEVNQRRDNFLRQLLIWDSDYLVFGTGRIGQRAQDIEYGADADLTPGPAAYFIAG